MTIFLFVLCTILLLPIAGSFPWVLPILILRIDEMRTIRGLPGKGLIFTIIVAILSAVVIIIVKHSQINQVWPPINTMVAIGLFTLGLVWGIVLMVKAKKRYAKKLNVKSKLMAV